MRSTLLILFIVNINFANAQKAKMVDPLSIDTMLTFSNLTIVLKPSDSIAMESYLLSDHLLDSIAKEYDNRFQESLALEKYLMRKFGARFKRDSSALFVKLDNGKWLQLETDPESDESVHTFEYYFEKFGFYSIRVQWGEGNAYKLVNSKTGKVTNIIGRPFFSPDGTKIICLGNDIEAGYSENGFQMLSNKSGNINQIGIYLPTGWGCEAAKWMSNNRLILKNESMEYDDESSGYFYFYSEIQIK